MTSLANLLYLDVNERHGAQARKIFIGCPYHLRDSRRLWLCSNGVLSTTMTYGIMYLTVKLEARGVK